MLEGQTWFEYPALRWSRTFVANRPLVIWVRMPWSTQCGDAKSTRGRKARLDALEMLGRVALANRFGEGESEDLVHALRDAPAFLVTCFCYARAT